MTIEDFSSDNFKSMKKVPRVASQTCKGQILIKPVVKPVLYRNENHISLKTLKEFGISKCESAMSHKYDHISQNRQLAANFKF